MSAPLASPLAARQQRAALAAAALAVAGAAISAYLAIVRFAGELPVCGPLVGCEQVATSEYSEILGIPVAVLGLGFSLAIFALVVVWARTKSRPAVLGAYGLGLVGIVVVAYLTYLELFVIHAVCVWCVGYAASVALGWAVIAWAIRR